MDLATTTRLREILERHGFTGDRVVLAAPAAHLQQEVLELPPRDSGAPLDQIAAAEIARTGKMEPGSFEMASWDLPAPPRANAGTSVMALAMRHTDAVAVLDPFEHAGFDVIGIDSQACALARLLAAPTSTGLSVVVDLGWNTGLIAFVHQGSVLFQRNLMEVNLVSLYRAVMSQFDVTEEVADHVLIGALAPATG